MFDYNCALSSLLHLVDYWEKSTDLEEKMKFFGDIRSFLKIVVDARNNSNLDDSDQAELSGLYSQFPEAYPYTDYGENELIKELRRVIKPISDKHKCLLYEKPPTMRRSQSVGKHLAPQSRARRTGSMVQLPTTPTRYYF